MSFGERLRGAKHQLPGSWATQNDVQGQLLGELGRGERKGSRFLAGRDVQPWESRRTVLDWNLDQGEVKKA